MAEKSTGTAVSLREKLSSLVRKLVRYMDKHKNTIFQFNNLVEESSNILRQPKKALEVLFYFEGLGIITRITQSHVVYVGLRGMVRKLYEYETDPASTKIVIQNSQRNIGGKLTSIKGYILGGNLISNIFYTLIYDKVTVTKSSVEDMVQQFMMQQKDLNTKNFVQESLNILANLGLIEKDESTEVIEYIGPDLRCYEENGKKVNWKVYELLKSQDKMLGKQIQQRQQFNNKVTKDPKILPPMHISHFLQMGFAVLRSSNWQQYIKKTIFFIGRSEKKSILEGDRKAHQVDLQLSHKSVSRQHACSKWQIRCLSRKNMIKVDDERIAWGDRNIWIKNRTEIIIGPEKMVFLQANPQFSQ